MQRTFSLHRLTSGSRRRPFAGRSLPCSAILLPLSLTLLSVGLQTGVSAQKASTQPAKQSGAKTQAVPPGGAPGVTPTPGPVDGTAILPNVLTYHNDQQRTGLNALETILTPASVAGGFGKKFTLTVDGTVYAQPLYVSQLSVKNIYSGVTTVHNVLIVATAHNSIYAFDADSNSGLNAGPLWHVDYNVPALGITPVPSDDITDQTGTPQDDIAPEIGVVGTPVAKLDGTGGGTLFVLVRTKQGNNSFHSLHSIDLTTGLDNINSPAYIGPSPPDIGQGDQKYPGRGDNYLGLNNDGSDSNAIYFDTINENQRPALALSNDGSQVYISYGSFNSIPPYHGWLFAYNTATLTQAGVFNTSPNSANTYVIGDPATGAAIDMSGSGPAIDDAGNLYLTTSAGPFNARPYNAVTPSTEYGESVLKIDPTLLPVIDSVPEVQPVAPIAVSPVIDSFTPYNYQDLSATDTDLGSGGVVILPDLTTPLAPGGLNPGGQTKLLVTAGREGKIYLLNRESLGGFHAGDDTQIVYARRDAVGPIFGVPAFFNGSLYYHGAGDVLRTYRLNTNFPYLTPGPSGTTVFDFPGATPSISSNGTASGIVWEIQPFNPGPSDPTFPFNSPAYAVLHAADASNTSAPELFSSYSLGGRNDIGNYVKYSVPTVAGGNVYVPGIYNGVNRIVAFGLRSPQTSQGDHYLITGPVVHAGLPDGAPAFLFIVDSGFPPFYSVQAKRSYNYSVSSLDVNNQPKKINATLQMVLLNLFTGARKILRGIKFNNQSQVIVNQAMPAGTYQLIVQDDQGHTDTSGTNQPNIVSYFTAFGSQNNGVDHMTVRVPPAAKEGIFVSIQVQTFSSTNSPYFYSAQMSIYDTLPDGRQNFMMPADTNAKDITPPFDPTPNSGPSSTTGLGYEYQNGFFDYSLQAFNNFSTFSLPANRFYAQYGLFAPVTKQNFIIQLHGIGKHVIIVHEQFRGAGTMTATGVVNVTP